MSESLGVPNGHESPVDTRIDEYDVVPYRPYFQRAIFELQKHLWSPDPELNAAYFHWKYECNPYLSDPLIYLALHGRQVVGMRGMWGAEWEIGPDGRRFIAPPAGDLVVAPPHRGRGLFRKIMDAAQADLRRRGFGFLSTLSAAETTYLLSMRAGWRLIGPYQMVRRSSKEEVDRRPTQLAPVDLRDSHVFRVFDRNGEDLKITSGRTLLVETFPRPREMADLIRRLPWDGRIRHVRDERFFSWRFRNPLSAYRFLFREGQRLEGYLVVQRSLNRRRRDFRIVDWEAVDSDVRRDLLEALVSLVGPEPLCTWSATQSKNTADFLKMAGFQTWEPVSRSARYRPGLLVKLLNDKPANQDSLAWEGQLLDLANWDLRMIYSDGY